MKPPKMITSLFVVLILFMLTGERSAQPNDTIAGVVRDANGPVAGATVRVQTSAHATTTNEDGRFTLTDLPADVPLKLTAWAPGYFCAGPVEAESGEIEVELLLITHATDDNPTYDWLPSERYSGQGENQGCAQCHSRDASNLPYTLPVDEWRQDAHAASVRNPRFLTMYSGTDIEGNQSPPTRYVTNRDYGRVPILPDPSRPYFGPGYRLDFPQIEGNCATCHVPAEAVKAPYTTDPRHVTGVAAEGISCDFCHKVWDALLAPLTGLPYPNKPGVLSIEFRRPPEGHQFFAGPFDDVAPGEDTYSPLQTQSDFCAPCHFGVFWETVVYNSFGEWLNSPYSDPETGQTCQDCHMPRLGATHFALPEQGGLSRDPQTIFSHRMPGAADEALLQQTAELVLNTTREQDSLIVTVTITNTQAGHHIPTDSPLRQILLVVSAVDAEDNHLSLISGPTLPTWAGDLHGQAGVYFVKILEEVWTGLWPSGAYWNPTRVLEDTRLPALASDTSTYTFSTSAASGPVKVEARLLFRRAFYDLMEQKGWDVPDILMENAFTVVQD